jgi:hypothetical protein
MTLNTGPSGMGKVMITITAVDRTPSIETVKKQYGLKDDQIDAEFGVIEVDPDEHTYTVLVDDSVVSRITSDKRWKVEGPFSNPRIEPFGPPEDNS